MSLLIKNHIKTLVAVGSFNNGSFVCNATSFLIGFLAVDNDNPPEKLYRIFLVTNRHVFDGQESVYLRFNTDDGNVKIFQQKLFFPDSSVKWLAHPDNKVDLALLTINPMVLKDNGIAPIFISEDLFGYCKDFEKSGIAAGDDVFAIGFPMGFSGEEQNYPCVKAGLISRTDKEIVKSNKAYIIDSSIFPGNSGGPVILRPSVSSLSDSIPVRHPLLIGVISGYIPYSEKLYSHQTSPPTVVSTYRENSGLTYCVPIDFVKEIYDAWMTSQKPVESAQANIKQDDVKEI